jgi:uncharacterized protein
MSEASFSSSLRKHEDRHVMEQGRFHKLLVTLDTVADWPGWLLALVLLPLAGLVVAVWWLVLGVPELAWGAAVILILFVAGDAILLWQLPARGLSFGPWQPQLVFLALPRTAVALVMGLIVARWIFRDELVWLAFSQAIGSAALIWGAFFEPFRLKLSEIGVTSDRLPAGVLPIRLLHLTDLHLSRITEREETLLWLVERARPDVIVLTGDYLNLSHLDDNQSYEQLRRLLGQLSAPYGVYASLGSPTVDARDVVPELFRDLPIRLLRDEHAEVQLDEQRRLVLLGVDCSHDMETDAAVLESVIVRAPQNAAHVLLYHSPELMPQACHHNVDLYLCGHTHGGQVRLPIYGAIVTSSQLGKRYEMGHYHERRTHLYVSRGIGLEGLSAPRVRFLCPPEVTLVQLQGSGR